MGFSGTWIRWIMLCVTTVSYSFCFNGSNIGPVIPRRGLRQGDPLSPYFFLICVEGLSEALSHVANDGRIHGCKVSQSAPSVTHILFVDDSFLFFKAITEVTFVIQSMLNSYERCSGSAINYQKSGIFLSTNVRLDKKEEIKDMLLVQNDLCNTKYLGLPSLVGRSKKNVFYFIKEKVWRRI